VWLGETNVLGFAGLKYVILPYYARLSMVAEPCMVAKPNLMSGFFQSGSIQAANSPYFGWTVGSE
jgi:hypothetical protein